MSRPHFSRWRHWVLAGVLLLAACSAKKGDPQEAARAFFAHVLAGETAPAYASSAFAFQSQQSEKTFSAAARELGLVGGKLLSLTPLETEQKVVKLQADLQTANGEPRPMVATFQYENGAWRLFSMRSPRDPKTGRTENRFSIVGKPPTFNEAVNKSIPAEGELKRMVTESMLSFSEAIKKRSFEDFYDHVSRAWQSQLTQKQLQRAFQGFIDQDVNLSGIAQVDPVFDATPHVTTEGLLMLSGYYPTTPFRVQFAFKYIYELPEWKLFGVDVYLQRATPPGTPAPATSPPAAPAP